VRYAFGFDPCRSPPVSARSHCHSMPHNRRLQRAPQNDVYAAGENAPKQIITIVAHNVGISVLKARSNNGTASFERSDLQTLP
jgi:hypothetical protein